MSRKRLVVAAALAPALFLLLHFGGRLAGGIENRLLSLHGHPPRPEEPAEPGAAGDAEDGWPDTPAGALARGWVEAFSAGEEAMRRFLEGCVTEASLQARPMAERLASYRELRNRYGSLMLASVAESTPEKLTAVLLAGDASAHRFVFTVEENDPHRLATVGIIRHGHGGSRP